MTLSIYYENPTQKHWTTAHNMSTMPSHPGQQRDESGAQKRQQPTLTIEERTARRPTQRHKALDLQKEQQDADRKLWKDGAKTMPPFAADIVMSDMETDAHDYS